MAEEFEDWSNVAVGWLTLPILGRTYRIPPLGHLDAIRLRQITADGATKLVNPDADVEPVSQEEYLRMLLGDALDEMRTDNVPDEAVMHAALTANADAFAGREAAKRMWRSDPEALAASLQAALATATKTAKPKASPQSRSSASATRTRSQVSTGSTTSRKATPRGNARKTTKGKGASSR